MCLHKDELVVATGYAICGLISVLWQPFAAGWCGTSLEPLENLSHEKPKANPVPELVFMDEGGMGHHIPCPPHQLIRIKQAISKLQDYILTDVLDIPESDFAN